MFENHYVKEDGVWKIAEMRLFPRMKADYFQGWAKTSSKVELVGQRESVEADGRRVFVHVLRRKS